MKREGAETRSSCRVAIPGRPGVRLREQQRPAPCAHVVGAELERTRWHPKDGELCPGRTRPEETLVEVRSDSDVQIDRPTQV